MIGSTCFPTIVLALTSGPDSPEFSSFTPVSASELVNTFSGDFSYNLPLIEVPGPHGSGYALSLSYNSGVSMEQEASWVGFGWTLNPGSITRNLRGLPDDFAGEEIQYYNKTRPSWTATAGLNTNMEIFSADALPMGGINAGVTHRINNYTGYQQTTHIGANVAGMIGVNASIDPNGVTFDPFITPARLITRQLIKNRNTMNSEESSFWQYNVNHLKNKLITKADVSSKMGPINLSLYGMSLAQETRKPALLPQYSGFAINWTTSLQVNPSQVPVGIETGKQGKFDLRFNKYKENKKTYGFLHTDKRTNSGLTDYYVEKNSPFQKQDVFLGMPFSNYDVFSVTGEGVIGGFRAYPDKIGYFTPEEIKSKTTYGQAGFEVMIGPNIGVGLDIGFGYNFTENKNWNDVGTPSNISSDFRFNGDKGGEINYQKKLSGGNFMDDSGLDHTPISTSGVKGFMSGSFDKNIEYKLDKDSNYGHSSFIETFYDNNKIDGFSVYNKDGYKFQYNKPVFVRNETTLSVNVNKNNETIKRFLSFKELGLAKNGEKYTVDNGYLHSSEHQTIIGDINTNKYAKSFLLTEILTPDYIDMSNNGISTDDFGGWTKFDYRQKMFKQNNNPWYRYRMPYNGLLYQQGSISDPKDDVGTVSTGEKEVYYLKTISTKTHIACFVTNKTKSGEFSSITASGSNIPSVLNGTDISRLDGLGALDLSGGKDPAAEKSENRHNKDADLEYLEKIVLFSVDINGKIKDNKPIKTICFEYDYSLVPNVVNNINSSYDYGSANMNNSSSGKLTLRKVWMEYQGVVSAKISPYIFNYHYPAPLVESKLYPFFNDGFYNLLTDNVQNPEYAPFTLDAWGNPMPEGEKRHDNGIPWIKQAAFLDENLAFDPAAYNLKSIQLPSGSTIHVQYESDDYAFVHDRHAMAMARIVDSDIGNTGRKYDENPIYYINVEDLGAKKDDSAEVGRLIELIKTHFKYDESTGEYAKKIYYKFLFSLIGNNSASLDSYQSEYITGYANITDVETITKDNELFIKITLGGENNDDGERALVPQQACYEFVVNQRQGKVYGDNGVEKFEGKHDEDIIDIANNAEKNDNISLKEKFRITPILFDMAFGADFQQYGNLDKKEVAQSFNTELSFFKLPVLNRKVGGGVRVKRILLHDKGIEAGDEVVLGTNYRYVLQDGVTSSGVATNEPSGAREENPLVDFMPVKGSSRYDKLISGDNIDQTEGPLGESLLPGAYVGYSRVISENIHTGETGTGFTIYEYYTFKDYPFDMYLDHPYNSRGGSEFDIYPGKAVDKTNIFDQTDNLNLNAVLFGYTVDRAWMSQGFRFVQNNMHGQLKKTSSYGGTYKIDADGENLSNCYLSTSQEYEYFRPGEKIRIMMLNPATNKLESSMMLPGKEMEVTREAKLIKDTSYDLNLEVDISIGIAFPPPIFVGIVPSFFYTENLIATNVTCKVISYPAILKSQTSYVDGISSKTEYLGFGKSTGEPILVRNTDSFNGDYGTNSIPKGDIYSLSVPAEWIYPEMGQKSLNSSYSNQLSAAVASFTVYNVEPDGAWWDNPVNVINSAIQTYKKDWSSSEQNLMVSSYNITPANQSKLNNSWRPYASYIFNNDLPDSQNNAKIFQRGYYDLGSANMFNWNSENQGTLSDKWLNNSRVTLYSPDGEVLEERDVLNIPSSVVYGSQYGRNVPAIVATNADYGSILFRDFEGNDNKGIIIENPHSGKQAAELLTLNVLDGAFITQELKKQGAIFKAWIQTGQSNLTLTVQGQNLPMQMTANVGDWKLFETKISPSVFGGVINSPLTGSISDGTYIDDIRFQPLNSTSTCFVYDDKNLRLLTQFDDQHFGLYYQYDMEGKLVRKIIETERGKSTIQEVNYNIPKQLRTSLK